VLTPLGGAMRFDEVRFSESHEVELKAREALRRAKENPQPALSLGVSI